MALDRSLTYRKHTENAGDKVKSRCNIIVKLAGTDWDATAPVLRTSAIALVYSVAEYCVPVWGRCRDKPNVSTTWVHSTETSVRQSKSSAMWHARCAESLYRWGVIASPACHGGESHQTTMHIVEEGPLTASPVCLRRLHEAGPGAVEWLSSLSMKL